MYAEFLGALAEIAQHLDKAAKVGSDGSADGLNLPTPYVYGAIEVRLEGDRVGEFRLEDEFALYYPDEGKTS